MTDLIDFEVRNQILLEGLKRGASDDFGSFVKRLDKFLRDLLTSYGDQIETKADLSEILVTVRKVLGENYEEYNDELLKQLEELAIEQADFELNAMAEVAEFEEVEPTPKAVLLSLYRSPMSIESYSGSLLLEPFIKDLTSKQIKLIENQIQQGHAQGKTVSEIVRAIRGTKTQNFKNGTLAQIDRSNQAIVHTAIQHASSVGRAEAWNANSDILKGYEWLSTLDSRTSQICRSLDGKVFKLNHGPLPPIHIRCRSTTLPAISDEFLVLDLEGDRPSVGAKGAQSVPEGETYYSWLKRQPKSFQERAIGKDRAKLLRDGGLNAEEFASLQLNKNFKPLTLEEMRKLRPEVFERAGL